MKFSKVDGVLMPVNKEDVEIFAEVGKDIVFDVDVTIKKQRTITQNKALHKYYGLLAEALNEAGYDMRKVIKEDVDIPWNVDSVKNYLWRPIQRVVKSKKSTTELKTNEINEIYNVLSRHISQKLGINVEFPSYR